MTTELEIKKESQIRVNDKAMDNLAKKVAEKAGISIDKAKQELGIATIMALMMNRHKIQYGRKEK